MTSIVSDPRTLTKDKLKKELSKFEVSLPSPDAKKDVYVELYKRHVLNEKSEFSSDEELSPKPRRKKPGSPKKALSKKPSKMQTGDIDVMSLSDQDLASMLRQKGVDVGPIVDTTRRIYQKKLERLLKESESGEVITLVNTQTSTPDTVDIADLTFSDEDQDVLDSPAQEVVIEEKEVSSRRQTRAVPPTPPRQTARRDPTPPRPAARRDPTPPRPAARRDPTPPRPAARRDPTPPRPVSRRDFPPQPAAPMDPTPDMLQKDEHLVRRTTRSKARVEKETEVTNNVVTSSASVISTSSSTSQEAAVAEKPKAKRGLSIWLQIGLFLIVALVIFFVIQNMEPAANDPTNKLTQEI